MVCWVVGPSAHRFIGLSVCRIVGFVGSVKTRGQSFLIIRVIGIKMRKKMSIIGLSVYRLGAKAFLSFGWIGKGGRRSGSRGEGKGIIRSDHRFIGLSVYRLGAKAFLSFGLIGKKRRRSRSRGEGKPIIRRTGRRFVGLLVDWCVGLSGRRLIGLPVYRFVGLSGLSAP